VSAKLGKLPTVAEYMEFANKIAPMAANIYRYLNFHEIEEYQSVAQKVIPIAQAA
jgi:aconitate hydratase 2 / 2-methylisocitrate dehydratase